MTVNNLDNLKIAFEANAYQSLAGIPAEEELVATQRFSARFERKMRRLIKKVGRFDIEKVAARKAAPARILLYNRKRLLAAAIILSILVSLFSITAAREAVFSFIVRVYDSFSTIIFNRDPAESDPTTAPSAGIDDIDSLLPTFIPDGYQLSDKLITDVFKHLVFSNTSGNSIMISKQDYDNTQFIIDTENVQTAEMKISGFDGIYYNNKGIHTIIWRNGSHVYMITSNIDKETLIKMAESTNHN